LASRSAGFSTFLGKCFITASLDIPFHAGLEPPNAGRMKPKEAIFIIDFNDSPTDGGMAGIESQHVTKGFQNVHDSVTW
jgi:hypothetical protein